MQSFRYLTEQIAKWDALNPVIRAELRREHDKSFRVASSNGQFRYEIPVSMDGLDLPDDFDTFVARHPDNYRIVRKDGHTTLVFIASGHGVRKDGVIDNIIPLLGRHLVKSATDALRAEFNEVGVDAVLRDMGRDSITSIPFAD